MTAWLPAAAEMEAYEGIRRGDEDAFRALAEPLQPTLRRLAGLYVDSGTCARAMVLRTWRSALRGLQMFAWHTPLATWIARITVASGRAHDVRAAGQVPRPNTPEPVREVVGPPDWSDLPWSERWEQAGATLADALAALPVDQREVVQGRDLEQWPSRRVCDVFGLPEATYELLIVEAHTRLHDALASLVGQAGPGPDRTAQIAAITRWLNQRLDARPEQLDPRALRVFHHWSATRQTRWRRLMPWLQTRDRLGFEPPVKS